MRATAGKANGAIQIAGTVDFYDRQTGVLHVVGAESAVVGAAVVHFGVKTLWHLGSFNEDFAS